jgi:NCAIR mutase (PurE)-related protein
MKRSKPNLRDLGFAHVDLHRLRRCGVPEVIYGAGKSPQQVVAIARSMLDAGQRVLATRVSDEQAAAVKAAFARAVHHATARAVTIGLGKRPVPAGLVAVVSAGTTDMPVAEEAALSAEHVGAKVVRIYDVGVAGLHRLMGYMPVLRRARAIVVAAGMEGALPSVVAGLVGCPVVAVPTSVGYGASFGGLAALLAMLNSCAAGVTVVNIDNGFGAGVAAALINRQGAAARPGPRRRSPRRRVGS